MRDWYETAADRENEHRIAEYFCKFMGKAKPVKSPLISGSYHIDYEARADEALMFSFEAKRRFVDFGFYRTMFISLNKVKAAYRKWYDTDKPVFWAIEFNNEVFAYTDLCWGSTTRYAENRRGRTDRNDPLDLETVWHIPLEEFRRWR